MIDLQLSEFNTDKITELLLKLEQVKSRTPLTHQDASNRFLEIENIEDDLYELGYYID